WLIILIYGAIGSLPLLLLPLLLAPLSSSPSTVFSCFIFLFVFLCFSITSLSFARCRFCYLLSLSESMRSVLDVLVFPRCRCVGVDALLRRSFGAVSSSSLPV